MTGTGAFLRSVNPRVQNLGVFTAPGELVPGPRSADIVTSHDIPWREVIDREEHVGCNDAYQTSLDLCRQGLLAGPSSGLALHGLYQFLDKARASGELDSLRDSEGEIKCVFLCCDQPSQYIADYFDKLPPNCFPPVHNQELIGVDTYPYRKEWKITPEEARRVAFDNFGRLRPGIVLLDLRDDIDFERQHDDGAVNLSIQCSGEPNPFHSPMTLRRQWTQFEQRLSDEDEHFGKSLKDETVVLLSYNGYTGDMLNAISIPVPISHTIAQLIFEDLRT
jgi:cysteine synthase A